MIRYLAGLNESVSLSKKNSVTELGDPKLKRFKAPPKVNMKAEKLTTF